MTRLPRPPPSSPQSEKITPYTPHRDAAIVLKGADVAGWQQIAHQRGQRIDVLRGALIRLRAVLMQHAWEETAVTTREVRVIFESLPDGWEN